MTQGNYVPVSKTKKSIFRKKDCKRFPASWAYSTEFIVQFDVEKIYDIVNERRENANKEVYQFQISPELKQLYESRIKSSETYVDELKSEIRQLKDQSLKQSV